MGLSGRSIAARTVSLLTDGYGWLPDAMRRSGGAPVTVRLVGKKAVALRGPDAVEFFYDEKNVRRDKAVPEPVVSTLFGHGAVHTLDGDAHAVRKAMFLSLLTDPARVSGLVGDVAAAWDDAAGTWPARSQIVLFDEAAAILTAGVHRWAGVPLEDTQTVPVARDLLAMVDGFATLGPRHWRARLARGRQEARLAGLVEQVRAGTVAVPDESAVAAVAGHRDAGGRLLDARTAAVELLNIVRPTVAVSWFVAFAAHAMHRWPDQKETLRTGDPRAATAFAHEVRRFYPFAPFSGGRAAADVSYRETAIPAGSMVLLDLYGQNHDPALWGDPYAFRPQRFLDHPADPDELIPQGGGPATGHRCPGEPATVGLLETLSIRLARLDYDVPQQRVDISLRRIPARPRSGFVITDVRQTAP